MKTKRTSRLPALVLALVMVATLLPTTALAATEYNLWVGGVQVTDANAADLAAASDRISGKVYYDDATQTLTLENATIAGDSSIDSGAAILAGQALTIQVIGTNTLTGAVNVQVLDGGLKVATSGVIGNTTDEDLAITGPGSLTCRASGGAYGNCGIAINGDLTVSCAALTVELEDALTQMNIGLSGARIEIDGCTLTATAESAMNMSLALNSNSGDVSIKNSTVTVSSGAVSGYAVYGAAIRVDYDLLVTNSTLTATSNTMAAHCRAGALTLVGSTAEASVNKDGSGAVPYDVADNDSYKYLKVTPTPAHPVTGGYLYFDNTTGTIIGCDATVTAANIPNQIGGVAVTTIGNGAFQNRVKLTSVTMSDNVSVICDHAFQDCTGLTNVILGNNMEEIQYAAFQGCTSLTGVTIPSSVYSIESYAFSGCTSLTGVDLPSGLYNIQDHAFENCESLESVTIPGKEPSFWIAPNAFTNCKSLKSVTIPDNVTDIDNEAFLGCGKLTSVIFQGNAPVLGTKAFPSTTTLYYQAGKTGWVPNWEGYKTVMLSDDRVAPITSTFAGGKSTVELIVGAAVDLNSAQKVLVAHYEEGAMKELTVGTISGTTLTVNGKDLTQGTWRVFLLGTTCKPVCNRLDVPTAE